MTWLELLDLIISCLEASVTSVSCVEGDVSHENSQVVNIHVEHWNRGEMPSQGLGKIEKGSSSCSYRS